MTELQEFALRLLASASLETKLSAPRGELSDESPGPPFRLARPERPCNLRMVPLKQAKVPRRNGMADPAQRARILHAFANHELQAVELFAWAILAFPGSEPAFRRGLLGRIVEEQEHCRLYLQRLLTFGVKLGDYPVSGYFWSKAASFTTPLRFVCGMCLTFENANLDHTLEFAQAARAARDYQTAALLERIHADEVEHVRFGLKWLERWKEESQSMAAAYCLNVTWPLRPALARGPTFHPQGRSKAGMDPDFIQLLSAAERGAPRAQSRS